MRKSEIYRKTKETEIKVFLNLDGEGDYKINTDVGFFNHMLETFCKHSIFDLIIEAKGDIEVDYHHLVEDVGICLGEAFSKALKNKEKIKRFGWAVIPMDEALSLVAVDICNRPLLVWDVKLKNEKIGNFDAALIKEFFKAFADNAKITLHIKLLTGSNAHHTIESIFKSFSKALSYAVEIDTRIKGIPSTKDAL